MAVKRVAEEAPAQPPAKVAAVAPSDGTPLSESETSESETSGIALTSYESSETTSEESFEPSDESELSESSPLTVESETSGSTTAYNSGTDSESSSSEGSNVGTSSRVSRTVQLCIDIHDVMRNVN
jgi:hypothetical protein